MYVKSQRYFLYFYSQINGYTEVGYINAPELGSANVVGLVDYFTWLELVFSLPVLGLLGNAGIGGLC
jgi:hypothetical protein